MCIDPLPDTKLSVLGNVIHAIHETNLGKKPLNTNKNSSIKPWKDILTSKNLDLINLFLTLKIT